MKNVSIKEINKKLADNFAQGRRITISDGDRVFYDKDRITGTNMITAFINEEDPDQLFVSFFRPDGSHAEGRKKYAPAGVYEVDLSSGLSGIEDATILEEKDHNGNVTSSLPGIPPIPENMRVEAFAYQQTAMQLNEAKQKIAQLERECRELRETKNKLDREILEHEHNAERLNEKLEKKSSLSGQMSGINEMLTQNPALAQMAGTLIQNLMGPGSAQASQMSGQVPTYSQIANAVAEWLSQQNEPTQKVVHEVLREAVKAYENGNDQIFDSILKHVLSNKSRNGNSMPSFAQN